MYFHSCSSHCILNGVHGGKAERSQGRCKVQRRASPFVDDMVV